jgi:hypothetical protein
VEMKIDARVLLILLTGLFVEDRLVLAQTDPAPDAETVTGTVVSSGNLSLVIDTDDGRRITLVLDGSSVLPAGQPAVGRSVVVQYRPLDSARSQATMVTAFETGDTAPRPSPPEASAPPDVDDPAAFAGVESPRIIVAIAALAALCLLGASLRLVRDAELLPHAHLQPAAARLRAGRRRQNPR